MDALDLTIQREQRKTERTVRDFGWGATDGALGIAEKYFGEYLQLFQGALTKEAKGTLRGNPRSIWDLDVEVVTLAALQGGIASVIATEAFSGTCRQIGSLIENEVWNHNLQTLDARVAKEIQAAARKRNGSFRGRKTVMRSLARKAGFVVPEWTDSDRMRAGGFLAGILLQGPVFCYETEDNTHVTLTAEACAVSEQVLADIIARRPIAVPTLTPPLAWESPETEVNGFVRPLVNRRDKPLQSHLRRASKAGEMTQTYAALNIIQGTAWSINTPILELIEWCYDNAVSVPGLPSRNDLPLPPRKADAEWEAMGADQKRHHKKQIGRVKERNRGFVGERLSFDNDRTVAHYLVTNGNKFWTPAQVDFRGRIYGMCYFNFQRGDVVRSLFQFAEGKPLDERGLYWLKVHVANCGAFDKIDKKSFDERVAWVESHWGDIIHTANDPRGELTWTTADKPFMYVAACQALVACLDDYDHACCLPISFDGSCSGLQHLCAMTQADEGHQVNLVPSDGPSDIYATVAEAVQTYIELDAAQHEDPAVRELAKEWLKFGINRSLVKRNVMTYSYSSGRYGMSQQVMDDTMSPLEDKVLSKELPEHPFTTPHVAARYLAKRSHEAIEDTVSKPAEAMRFLQGIARAAAHESKPLVWHTPLGFPVMQRVMHYEKKQVRLQFMDRGITPRVFTATSLAETSKVNKRKMANAVAPNFVHSLDACHLMMVALEAKAQGIEQMAFVHDSFGCLPTDADKFRSVILTSFRDMYTQHDVLGRIRQEAIDQLQASDTRIPETPVPGLLDLNKLTEATYAFS
jgi:DNA-directed RNA polymerase